MFSMMKFLIKFIIFIVFLTLALVVAGNYQLVHSKSGFHVLERENWGFSDFYINTADWNALDFAKNPRISSKLFKDRFQAVFNDASENVQTWWQDVTKDSSFPELKDIKREFDQGVTHLNKSLQENKLTIEKYHEKLKALKKETEKKVQKVLKALKED